MKLNILAGATLTVLASASPVALEKRTGKQVLDKFDDLKVVPGAPILNQIGVYNGIDFGSFFVLSTGVKSLGVPLLTGVKPHSGSQYIGAALIEDVLKGAPGFTVDSTSYSSFDLQSLYFGCLPDSVTSITGLPQSCTIAFTAYKNGNDSPFETLNFQYNPRALLAPMAQAKFPASWNKLRKVEVATVSATTTSTLNALVVDDVAYKLNK